MTTLDIQRRLYALGHDPGPLDGVRGRLTISAIKAFQAERGLQPDGIAGPLTQALLFGAPPQRPGATPVAAERRSDAPAARCGQNIPWYEEALRLKGVTEARGEADNPTILGWAKRLGIGYAQDSVAWCGLFAAHCVAASLPDEPLPVNPLGARNWRSFGRPVEPTLGSVLVFWRGSKASWSGHVGFYAGEDATALHVLGGNQSDAVTVTRIARTRLLGARWPSTAPFPRANRIQRAEAGSLSTNEA